MLCNVIRGPNKNQPTLIARYIDLIVDISPSLAPITYFYGSHRESQVPPRSHPRPYGGSYTGPGGGDPHAGVGAPLSWRCESALRCGSRVDLQCMCLIHACCTS